MNELGVINRGLAATGNSTLVIQNDGSPEGNQGEIAISRAKDYVVAAIPWVFQNKTAELIRAGDSDLPPYSDKMQYPPDCWQLISVIDDSYGIPQKHKLQGGFIHTYSGSGLLAEYTAEPVIDSKWHALAIEAVTIFVESLLYRGLNEDIKSADDRWAAGELVLARAGGRVGQQNTPGSIYKSSLHTARRTRKV